MNKKRGFTLVELLIVMTIIIIFALLGGLMNAIATVNKGRDAQRKKDLKTIKIAFEEYFNDKESFPPQSDVNDWNIESNCGRDAMAFLSLTNWPCDPSGFPYFIKIETGNKFRIFANLQNKKDKDIPSGWYLKGDSYKLFGLGIYEINYGVSSTNILWYDP